MKDNLEHIFKNLENEFDTEEPTIGHFKRFEEKLNSTKTRNSQNNSFKIWMLPIAASILLFIGIWIGKSFSNNGLPL